MRIGSYQLICCQYGGIKIRRAYGHFRRVPWYNDDRLDNFGLRINSIHEFRDKVGWKWFKIDNLFGRRK